MQFCLLLAIPCGWLENRAFKIFYCCREGLTEQNRNVNLMVALTDKSGIIKIIRIHPLWIMLSIAVRIFQSGPKLWTDQLAVISSYGVQKGQKVGMYRIFSQTQGQPEKKGEKRKMGVWTGEWKGLSSKIRYSQWNETPKNVSREQ